MYKVLYPKKDTTLYEWRPDVNTGIDQILEVTKYTEGQRRNDVTDSSSAWGSSYNSRVLIEFDLDDIASKVSGSEAKFYLNLRAVQTQALSHEYTLYAYPISDSWINGNGNYGDEPPVSIGTSWYYRSSEYISDHWTSGSGVVNYSTVSGGGSWNDTYESSQSFSFTKPDVRMDITNIVNAWISGSIPNYGIILKYSDSDESSNTELGSLKFFSRETHTIYLPKIEAFWDTSSNYSGSFLQNTLVGNDYVVYFKNLRNSYRTNEYVKLRLAVRDRYPKKTYRKKFSDIDSLRLPATSYFSIVDYVTLDVIVDYDSIGTKIESDDDGHYINLDLSNFLPVRYYKILLKIIDENGIHIIDNNFNFRIADDYTKHNTGANTL